MLFLFGDRRRRKKNHWMSIYGDSIVEILIALPFSLHFNRFRSIRIGRTTNRLCSLFVRFNFFLCSTALKLLLMAKKNYREMPSHVTYVLSSVQRKMPLSLFRNVRSSHSLSLRAHTLAAAHTRTPWPTTVVKHDVRLSV